MRNPLMLLSYGYPTTSYLLFLPRRSLFLSLSLVVSLDGIGDEKASIRQPGLVGVVVVVPIALVFSGSDSAAGQQEESASKTRTWRKGDHRLIRSDFARSKA